MQQKTILVVGGAGYIGSHVNKMLHNEGFNTIVFDNLSRGNKDAVVRGIVVEGDTSSKSDLDAVFSQYDIDAVMHFAAYTSVGESVYDPSKYYKNNTVNTIKLLDAMVRHDVKTFIFSSTAAIFGTPEMVPVCESHPSAPINPYGVSKLMVEKILADYDVAYDLKSCCLRYFNAAGGDPDGEIRYFDRVETNIIPIVLKSLLSNTPVTIFGTDYDTPDGTCIRDYIHVCDLGAAHINALRYCREENTSSAYNLGNGNGFSVREVIEAVERVTKKKIEVIEGDRRAGDPARLIADSSKARSELGWEPKYSSLDAMISHAWQAMTAHSCIR
jgi:UDP-glucose 4-epimerase